MRRLAPLLVGLAACNPPYDVEPLACINERAGIADLGEGDLDSGFLPLEDGDDIYISFGPQGMHMIVVSLEVADLELPRAGGVGSEVQIALRLDNEVVGGTVNQMQPSAVTDGVAEFLGLRAVITEAEVDDLAGLLVDVEGTVRDGCGRDITATNTLRFQK